MEVLLGVTVLFALALLLSFLVERLLEILKTFYNLLDSLMDWHEFWTRRAEKLRDRLEKRLRIFEYVEPKRAAVVLHRIRAKLLNEQGDYSGTVPVLSGDLVRAAAVKSSSKIIGIGLGVGLALWMNIDLVTIWRDAAGGPSAWVITNMSENMRIALSGAMIGLGSGPVHKLIATIEKKREL